MQDTHAAGVCLQTFLSAGTMPQQDAVSYVVSAAGLLASVAQPEAAAAVLCLSVHPRVLVWYAL